jgi:hypothetical protein
MIYWPIAEVTLANINLILCSFPEDPWYGWFDYHYYLAAEVYLGGSSIIFKYIYQGLFWTLEKLFIKCNLRKDYGPLKNSEDKKIKKN